MVITAKATIDYHTLNQSFLVSEQRQIQLWVTPLVLSMPPSRILFDCLSPLHHLPLHQMSVFHIGKVSVNALKCKYSKCKVSKCKMPSKIKQNY